MESACRALKTEVVLTPDQRIVEAVVSGELAAYEQLVERYWGRIYGRVYQLLGNREDAEEVTQDTFSRALGSLEAFRGDASFSTWLYQIASNLARNRYWYWKRRRRDSSISLDKPLTEEGNTLSEVLPEEGADPGERMRWQEFEDSIEREMAALPERHQSILRMRLLEDRSYEAISEELGVPLGTVKSRIARARECLCRALGVEGRRGVQRFARRLHVQRS